LIYSSAGYMVAYNAISDEELSALKSISPPAFSGVEQSEEILQWIWENFSAVAGDQPSFECWRKTCPLHLLAKQD
jgi:hypothetical protein